MSKANLSKKVSRQILDVFLIGSRGGYAVPLVLKRTGRLGLLISDFYHSKDTGSFMRLILKTNLASRVASRKHVEIGNDNVVSFAFAGLLYMILRKLCSSQRCFELSNVIVVKLISLLYVLRGPNIKEKYGIYCFNTAALEMFRRYKSHGRLCILEQTILPRVIEREILLKESRLYGAWYKNCFLPEDGGMHIRREAEEWRLSDHIIVASTFLKEGLVSCGVDEKKINVIPYGFDYKTLRYSKNQLIGRRKAGRVGLLKVLFAGEVGLRKGAHYLLQIADKSLEIELHFAGKVNLTHSKIEEFQNRVKFYGALPKPDMHNLFYDCDVLVLPTLVEGSALVTYEAISYGLPVITTINAGSLVINEQNGIIVETSSVDSLYKALLIYVNNPQVLQAHSLKSLELREVCSMARYQRDLMSFIEHC